LPAIIYPQLCLIDFDVNPKKNCSFVANFKQGRFLAELVTEANLHPELPKI